MSKIITFFGADHKCGTGMISQCVAEALSDGHKNEKVLLLHANQGPGDDYSPSLGESMERIRPYIAEKLTDYEELAKRCVYHNNLYIIGGCNALGEIFEFAPDSTQSFIKGATEYFDYVICDAGAQIDNGLALGAMFSADRICYVLSQRESALRHFEYIKSLINSLNLDSNYLVINMYDKNSEMTREYIGERLGKDAKKINTVRYSPLWKLADEEYRSLLSFKKNGFCKDIQNLCSLLC